MDGHTVQGALQQLLDEHSRREHEYMREIVELRSLVELLQQDNLELRQNMNVQAPESPEAPASAPQAMQPGDVANQPLPSVPADVEEKTQMYRSKYYKYKLLYLGQAGVCSRCSQPLPPPQLHVATHNPAHQQARISDTYMSPVSCGSQDAIPGTPDDSPNQPPATNHPGTATAGATPGSAHQSDPSASEHGQGALGSPTWHTMPGHAMVLCSGGARAGRFQGVVLYSPTKVRTACSPAALQQQASQPADAAYLWCIPETLLPGYEGEVGFAPPPLQHALQPQRPARLLCPQQHAQHVNLLPAWEHPNAQHAPEHNAHDSPVLDATLQQVAMPLAPAAAEQACRVQNELLVPSTAAPAQPVQVGLQAAAGCSREPLSGAQRSREVWQAIQAAGVLQQAPCTATHEHNVEPSSKQRAASVPCNPICQSPAVLAADDQACQRALAAHLPQQSVLQGEDRTIAAEQECINTTPRCSTELQPPAVIVIDLSPSPAKGVSRAGAAAAHGGLGRTLNRTHDPSSHVAAAAAPRHQRECAMPGQAVCVGDVRPQPRLQCADDAMAWPEQMEQQRSQQQPTAATCEGTRMAMAVEVKPELQVIHQALPPPEQGPQLGHAPPHLLSSRHQEPPQDQQHLNQDQPQEKERQQQQQGHCQTDQGLDGQHDCDPSLQQQQQHHHRPKHKQRHHHQRVLPATLAAMSPHRRGTAGGSPAQRHSASSGGGSGSKVPSSSCGGTAALRGYGGSKDSGAGAWISDKKSSKAGLVTGNHTASHARLAAAFPNHTHMQVSITKYKGFGKKKSTPSGDGSGEAGNQQASKRARVHMWQAGSSQLAPGQPAATAGAQAPTMRSSIAGRGVAVVLPTGRTAVQSRVSAPCDDDMEVGLADHAAMPPPLAVLRTTTAVGRVQAAVTGAVRGLPKALRQPQAVSAHAIPSPVGAAGGPQLQHMPVRSANTAAATGAAISLPAASTGMAAAGAPIAAVAPSVAPATAAEAPARVAVRPATAAAAPATAAVAPATAAAAPATAADLQRGGPSLPGFQRRRRADPQGGDDLAAVPNPLSRPPYSTCAIQPQQPNDQPQQARAGIEGGGMEPAAAAPSKVTISCVVQKPQAAVASAAGWGQSSGAGTGALEARPRPAGQQSGVEGPPGGAREVKYTEVVRGKAREGLQGYACQQCREFYEAMVSWQRPGTTAAVADQLRPHCGHAPPPGPTPASASAAVPVGQGGPVTAQANLIQESSRHRARWIPPPSTPDGFWSLTFPEPHANTSPV